MPKATADKGEKIYRSRRFGLFSREKKFSPSPRTIYPCREQRLEKKEGVRGREKTFFLVKKSFFFPPATISLSLKGVGKTVFGDDDGFAPGLFGALFGTVVIVKDFASGVDKHDFSDVEVIGADTGADGRGVVVTCFH